MCEWDILGCRGRDDSKAALWRAFTVNLIATSLLVHYDERIICLTSDSTFPSMRSRVWSEAGH